MKIDSTISKKVGQRIKDLRKKRGLTQEKLAELSGIDPKHLQLMESNRPSNSRVDTIQYIASAFGLTISEFFSDESFMADIEKLERLRTEKSISGLLKAKSPYSDREKLFEDNLSYAIYDKFPVNRGHILIIPKRHFASYFLALPEEKQSLWEMVEKAKFFLEREFKPDGYNIGINDGEAAGQITQILEVHIIPRYKNDTKSPKSGIRRVIPDK
ncbi:MAG: HIT domain-containing protein [Leptospiraceae bacterium]|nr:HIT domain-containing protein [Leptospiraceae bacterium]